MLDAISINAFKSFPAKTIHFKRLNVLTGLNNSGKSTILQAIRMCDPNKGPYLEGLGYFSEIRSKYSPSQEDVVLSLEKQGSSVACLKLNSQGHQYTKEENDLPLMEYIGADRYGPRVALPIIEEDFSNFSVGQYGQYSAHYAKIFENIIVHPDLRHKDSASNTLRHQLIKWMGEVSPGVKLEFDVASRYDSSSIVVDENRSTNSGFGLSYSLPIVLALLTLTGELGADDSNVKLPIWYDRIRITGAALLIENPEAHLHPRGQTSMGRLIALAASAGLQIFLETHSDHLLDGIRLGVKNSNGKLIGDDVRIKYFTKTEKFGSEVHDIALRNDGKIEHWPAGFFDQFSLNLRALSTNNGSN
ncbi:MAG TPA: DUF3696 domain-containing protein [Rhodocyclaceae bacterium]|nr:DUF3696 domain-containing protein [Rhodocyclaceae bacterium]